MTYDKRLIGAALVGLLLAGLSSAACARPKSEAEDKAAAVPKRVVTQDKVKPPAPGVGTAVTPVPAADKLPEWKEASGYDLLIGGQPDELVRVFQSPDFQTLLVLPSQGELAWLLTLKSKATATLPRAAVSTTAEGATLAADKGAPGAPFTAQNSEIIFKIGTAEARLAPEPPLVGALQLETLLAKKKEYALAARQYTPNGAAISLLKSAQSPVEIVVFFGTWCSYCKKWLPRFIRTIQDAQNPKITVRYYGVDEDFSQPETEINKYGIRKTPTFVVLSGSAELGRITEEPTKSVEQDLALILFSSHK